MRILLLAMPDTADVIDYYFRLHNLAIISLAGSLPNHDVKVVDLVACKPHVGNALRKILERFRPELVGMSAMTFQFHTLLKIARLIRSHDAEIRLVAGGYHATLMAAEITASHEPVPLDYMVRGEGEGTISELVDHLEGNGTPIDDIKGLSYRAADGWRHNPDRPLQVLSHLPLPNRNCRLKTDLCFLGLPMDVAETSRGCPFNCKFCSISHMYGNTFRTFPIERIVEDLLSIRAKGTKGVFFADDNITFDIGHLRRVCRAIVENGLDDMFYATQVSAAGIAKNPDIAAELKRANFHLVFVGFESMDPNALKGMKKPSNPEINERAASLLRHQGIVLFAGCIVGYPDDTKSSIAHQYRLIKRLKPDVVYAQYMTPYPKTVIRKELMDEKLIENEDDFSTYDGFSCNIRTRHMDQKALYRSLKKESVKLHFTPSIVFSNKLLRHYRGRFLRPVLKTIGMNVFNVLSARQGNDRLGL